MEQHLDKPFFDDPAMRKLEQQAVTFVRSGFFPDTKTASQAIVKVMLGADLGIGPVPAMQGIHVINGKIELSANILATLVKRSGRYDYDVAEWSDEKCALDFIDISDPPARRSMGRSEFTIGDAQRAGLVRSGGNWTKWPRAMLFARAMSQGVRTFAPDVTSGTAIYAEGEISGEDAPLPPTVDVETGELVDWGPELPTTVITSGGPIDDPIGDVQAAMPSLERPVLVPPPVARATPAQLAEIMAYRKELKMDRDEALALIGLPPVAEGERIDLSQDQATALIVALAERGDR